MVNSRSSIAYMIYAGAIVLAVISLAMIPWWTVDDAFISYRYGRNLLLHGQLTWNVGAEPHVEGYTGIFLPLLAAGILAIGLPLQTTVKLLGIVAMIGIAWLLRKTLRRMGIGSIGQSLAVLGLAGTPILYMHTISGLETVYFTFFISGAILALWGSQLPSLGFYRFLECGVFLFLAGISRPEGILLATLVATTLLVYWTMRRFDGQFLFRSLPVFASVVLLAAYWLLRAEYYGNFFPNSFHAKVFEGVINWESVVAFGKFAVYYCLLPAMTGLVLFLGNPKPRLGIRNPFIGVSLLFVAMCMAMYFHSNLWMNYGSRFFFPFLPVFMVVIMAFATRQWKEIRSRQPQDVGVPQKLRRVLWGIAILQAGTMGFRYRQEWSFLNYYHKIVQEELIPAGQYLSQELDPDATVISYMDAGAIGYYSNLHIVDFGRLSDAYLAQKKPDLQEVLDYFFSIDAAALVMTSHDENELQYTDEAMAIVSDPRFDVFKFERQWSNSAHYPYWQRLYLKQR